MKAMKKVLSLAVVAAMALSVFACSADTAETTSEETQAAVDYEYMSYAEYDAAALDTEVTVLCTVMATQSWWEDQITVYARLLTVTVLISSITWLAPKRILKALQRALQSS